MKKKILLALTIVAMLCLFALSVSAEEVDGVFYTLDAKNQVATVNKSNRTAQTEIAVIPSVITYEGVEYRVTKIENDAFAGNKTVKEIRILSEYITAIPYGMILNTYDGALKKIYINFSNITTYASAALNPSNQGNGNDPKANPFYYYDAKAFLETGEDVVVTEPDFSNVTSFGTAAFQGANFEKVVIPDTIKDLNNQIFRKSTIKELVIEGDTLETISYYVFQACSNLKKITIESCNLKSISNDVFANCTAVEEIYIDLSSCEEVRGSAFMFSTKYDAGQSRVQWYNTKGEKVVDLSSMKRFVNGCFASSNLGSATIIWPEAISLLEDQCFRLCNINQPMIINAAEGVTLTLPFWAFNGNNPTILLCNEGVTATAARFTSTTAVFLAPSLKITDGERGFKSASTLYTYGLTEDSKVPKESEATIVNITSGSIYNYGACGIVGEVYVSDEKIVIGKVVHTTVDAINNAFCPIGKVLETSCKFCEYAVYTVDGEEVEKKAHTYDMVGKIVYESYFDMGFKTLMCECGAEDVVDEATEQALFIDYGYSCTEAAINGKYSVSQFFGINRSAVDAYIAVIGVDFDFGVVVSSVGNPMDESNSSLIAQGKTYVSSSNAIKHDYVVVNVTGFTDGENGTVNNLDRQLAFCLYVIDGERISYLDNGETVNTVTMKSYNDVLASK